VHYLGVLGFCASALKFFAVGYGLLGVSVSILPRGRRTPTPRKSLPIFAEKLLMRFRTKTLKSQIRCENRQIHF